MERRWEGDERGHGVTDGRTFLPRLEALAEAMGEPGWVAEDPHAHLLPHIVRACAAGEDLAVLETHFTDDGIYDVTLDWRPRRSSPPLRERIHQVVAAFAESATHVVQRVENGSIEYDVVTGMLEDDTHFRPHGHLVRFRIVGERAPYG